MKDPHQLHPLETLHHRCNDLTREVIVAATGYRSGDDFSQRYHTDAAARLLSEIAKTLGYTVHPVGEKEATQ